MEKVNIMSRVKFLDWVPPVPTDEIVAIRIGDSLPKKDDVSRRYLDVLYLAFYDIYQYADQIDRNTPIGSNRLTAKDKVIVDEFIDKYKDKYFAVHCEMGQSRRAAVGYYILKRLGYTEELNEKKESIMYFPNLEVYGILIGKPYTKETATAIRNEVNKPDYPKN